MLLDVNTAHDGETCAHLVGFPCTRGVKHWLGSLSKRVVLIGEPHADTPSSKKPFLR